MRIKHQLARSGHAEFPVGTASAFKRPLNAFAYFHVMIRIGAHLRSEIAGKAWRAMARRASPMLRDWIYARALHSKLPAFDALRLAYHLVPQKARCRNRMKGSCLLETFNARFHVERESEGTPDEVVWVVERTGEYIWSFDAPAENLAVGLCGELNERDLSHSEALAYAQSRFWEDGRL